MPLKKKDLARFKERLEILHAKLARALKGVVEEVKAPDDSKGYSQHQADEGTDDFNRIISLELSNQDHEIFKQVEHALEKIENGSYGICDVTGKEIPIKRLEAIPYTNMTVEAQEQLEKGYR